MENKAKVHWSFVCQGSAIKSLDIGLETGEIIWHFLWTKSNRKCFNSLLDFSNNSTSILFFPYSLWKIIFTYSSFESGIFTYWTDNDNPHRFVAFFIIAELSLMSFSLKIFWLRETFLCDCFSLWNFNYLKLWKDEAQIIWPTQV